MAETIFSLMLNELSTFIREEGNLLGGLEQEVQHISIELETMTAFLKVAEAKEEDDPRLQVWLKQVREVAYDIEDAIDEFKVLSARRHAHGLSHCLKRLRARHKIAKEIQSIKSSITIISNAHQRHRLVFGIHHHSQESALTTNTRWDNALLAGNPRLVGIQKPKEELNSQLLDGDSRLKVIPVLGMQGVGKTTLVKKVHEDSNMNKQFQISAWINVPQTRSTKELLQDLIRQIVDQIKRPITFAVESITNLETLKNFVSYLLLGKRYKIVFDDVCDKNIWNSIKSALPDSGNSSRVMVTTRSHDVAQSCSPESQGYVYKMKPLSFEDSWTLFCDRTFEDGSCPINLKAIVQDILRKCQGLPLAIVAIGGFLASKDKNKADQWEIVRDDLGGEEEETSEDRVKKILHLSYKSLPSHLKTCLLYISIFPENHEIQCHRLIQLWIAERFVQERGMTAEEEAFEYLKELIKRSLVQVTEVSWDGSADHCRIHDLMREFIVHKSQEQKMFTIASGQQASGHEKVHRLVINNSPKLRRQDGEGLCSSLQKLTKLHELDVTAIAKDEVLDMDHPLPSSSLQSLRGLILRGRLEKFPSWINSLQSLKKIDLFWSMLWGDDPLQSLQHLPNLAEVCLFQAYEGEGLCFSGGGFLKLETLNLRNMQGLKRIAVEDGAMPRLRRLYISELPQLEELPWGVQHLRELQSLHLGDMSSEFTEKLLNPDVQTGVRRKIAHIPEVIIGFRTAEEWKEYRL